MFIFLSITLKDRSLFQPRVQGLSSFRSLEREKRDPGNEVETINARYRMLYFLYPPLSEPLVNKKLLIDSTHDEYFCTDLLGGHLSLSWLSRDGQK